MWLDSSSRALAPHTHSSLPVSLGKEGNHEGQEDKDVYKSSFLSMTDPLF